MLSLSTEHGVPRLAIIKSTRTSGEQAGMQCDVCQRAVSSKLPFNCTMCARDSLYQPRLKYAQLLLEKESIEKQVERSVHGTTKASKKSSSSGQEKEGISPAWIVRRASAEQTTCEEQTDTIQAHVQILRQETQLMKTDIAARRKALEQKRSELASAKQELSHFQETAPEPLRKTIRRITYRWDTLHSKTAEGRVFLCREAADLYSLQHHRRKKGSKTRDTYTIGGVPIADLRDLNSEFLILTFPLVPLQQNSLTTQPQKPLQPNSQSRSITSPTSST